jgi:hypothetical protein
MRVESERCKRCGTSCLLARDLAANGKPQYFWWCAHCARVADPSRPFVAKEYIVRVLRDDPDTLPIITRYPELKNPKCEYHGCERTDTEYHHWAPRHLFTDAEDWPGSYLCGEHHPHWHRIMTPHMSQHRNGRAPARPKVTVIE